MMKSKTHSEKYMTNTISPNRVEELIQGINEYRINVADVTMEELLQVCFLQAMYGDDDFDMNMNQTIMYGGNLFNIHVCLAQINPNQPVEALKGTQ